MFWLGNPFGTQQRPSYLSNREAGKLYYKDHTLDLEMTPRQLIQEFPELIAYTQTLVGFGIADVKVENLCKQYGMQYVQNLIDSMTR